MPEKIDLEGLARRLGNRSQGDRQIVAIAGAPGSGKSTFSEALRTILNKANPGSCEVLPMDGYHYDDLYLGPMGWQSRKGAPHTFDVAGLAAMLARLKAKDAPEIAVPVFDRKLEIARAGARMIDPRARIILVEGNYLLLKQPPWSDLGQFFDTSVMLDVPRATLIKRLQDRWASFGYSQSDADEKIAQNDLLNIKEVVENSIPADYLVNTES